MAKTGPGRPRRCLDERPRAVCRCSVPGHGGVHPGSVLRISATVPVAAVAPGQDAARRRRIVAVCAIALAAGHLVLLGAPHAVLRWNRSMARLLLAEGAGI